MAATEPKQAPGRVCIPVSEIVVEGQNIQCHQGSDTLLQVPGCTGDRVIDGGCLQQIEPRIGLTLSDS